MNTLIKPTLAEATDGRCEAHQLLGARTTVTGGFIGTVLALGSTLAIYLVGNAGAPIRVVTGWTPDGAELSVAEVVITVILAVAMGSVLLGVTQPRIGRAWRAWTITATLFAAASAVPLMRLDVDRGSKMALASMHLATGAAAIAGQAIARRRTVGNGGWR
jgi:Family of unknown function (DUF6069)